MAQRHRRLMIHPEQLLLICSSPVDSDNQRSVIRTGQLLLICPPLAHSLLSTAALGGRNIIAQIRQLVNRQIAQKIKFVQFAQNDTHGTIDAFLSTADKQLFVEKS